MRWFQINAPTLKLLIEKAKRKHTTMAINFSASFAACLAAGLKVPRQIMYCISQDTGAPYVLYKDSQEAAERGALAGSGQWNADMYPSMQQSPQQAHLANHHVPQLPPVSISAD